MECVEDHLYRFTLDVIVANAAFAVGIGAFEEDQLAKKDVRISAINLAEHVGQDKLFFLLAHYNIIGAHMQELTISDEEYEDIGMVEYIGLKSSLSISG